MISGLLVAPMMNTVFFEPMPSISVRSLVQHAISGAATHHQSWYHVWLAIESSSSKKSTHGATLPSPCQKFRARWLQTHQTTSSKARALDRDEVRLALVRDRLGEKRLTTTRRAVEENTLGGAMPNFSNFSGCSTGYCTVSCKLLLDSLKSTNIVPRHVRHFDDSLAQAQRGWSA